jgi:hypothetical protein
MKRTNSLAALVVITVLVVAAMACGSNTTATSTPRISTGTPEGSTTGQTDPALTATEDDEPQAIQAGDAEPT